jgi:hypothetical protein
VWGEHGVSPRRTTQYTTELKGCDYPIFQAGQEGRARIGHVGA